MVPSTALLPSQDGRCLVRRSRPVREAVVGEGRADQSRRLVGDRLVTLGSRHAGVAGTFGGTAAAGRRRRGRKAACGRRGAHRAAIPAVPRADAVAGGVERDAQRLHVVLDPVALLAQLGQRAGPLPVSRLLGLDR